MTKKSLLPNSDMVKNESDNGRIAEFSNTNNVAISQNNQQSHDGIRTTSVRDRILLNDPSSDHIFLKVTPNLFTQQKLHLFDTLELYTSLIKCSKFLEQGERLHNYSWRIINKSLFKDRDINKSKKRDGVKSLYGVINPVAQTHLRQVPLPTNNTVSSASTFTTFPVPSLKHGVNHVENLSSLPQNYQQKSQPPDNPMSNIKKKSSKFSQYNGNKMTYIEGSHSSEIKKIINDPSFSLFGNINKNGSLGKKDKSLFSNGIQSTHDIDNLHRPCKEVFLSSDEDESDWNSTEDSDFDEDPEDYHYYQRQWDKLVFTKSHVNSKTNIRNSDTSVLDENHEIKRSLLSGLFLDKSKKLSQQQDLNSDKSTNLSDTSNSLEPILSLEIHNETIDFPEHISRPLSNIHEQGYSHQSNAPLTAQTLLPTALSTHMFLPNNIHQQRMNKGLSEYNNGNIMLVTNRRGSIDIPSKNRNNSFLKTRMEISKEEKCTKVYSRRN